MAGRTLDLPNVRSALDLPDERAQSAGSAASTIAPQRSSTRPAR